MVGCRGKAKLFKTAGVYSRVFKVAALREEMGDPLDIYIYSFNSDISPK